MLLTYEMLRHAGTIMKHVVGVLILCWRRMLRAMGVAGLAGLILAELAGSLATHRFPPAPLSHVVAFVMAAALAYAAALTVLIDELLGGAIATVRVAEGEVSAGVRALAALAKRERGEAGRGISRRVGRPPASQRATPMPQDVLGSTGIARGGNWDVRYDGVTAETLADIAATEEFSNTAPHPRVDARPVRADQFPRIEWAADLTEESGPHMLVPSGRVASAPMPPIPMRGEQPPAPVSSLTDRPSVVPARTVPVTTRPLTDVEGDGGVWNPPRSAAAEGAVSQAHPREQSRSVSRPRPRPEAASGLWSRIGRALVGNTRPLEADTREDVAAQQARDDTPASP